MENDIEPDDADESGHKMSSMYWDMEDALHECEYCGSKFWYDERLKSYPKVRHPKFPLCCMHGKVKLPYMRELLNTLFKILPGTTLRSELYKNNIRSFNSMFSFTSMGGKIDMTYNDGKSPPMFIISGQNYHLLGNLLPSDGKPAKYSQLYIYDMENEVINRMKSVGMEQKINAIHGEIVADLRTMLNIYNVFAKNFRMVGQKFNNGNDDFRLVLKGKRGTDGRTFNTPTVSEVAALFVGDFELNMGDRDIIIETKKGYLQRINELNAAYIGLQYPLLFPYVRMDTRRTFY